MKLKIQCLRCHQPYFKCSIATCGWWLLLGGAEGEHSCYHRRLFWAALPARDFGPTHRIFSSVVPCDICRQVMNTWLDLPAPLSFDSGACLSRCFTFCSLFLPRRKLAGYGRWSCLKNRMGWEFRLVEAEDQSAHLTLSLSPK